MWSRGRIVRSIPSPPSPRLLRVMVDPTDVDSVHQVLLKMATKHACTSSMLNGTTSRHVLPDPLSFRTLSALHEASNSSEMPHEDFVASSGTRLVYAVKFGKVAVPSIERLCGKKRQRGSNYVDDEHELQVENARAKLGRVSSLPERDLEKAAKVLKNAVRTLRGPHGESVVQSFAILDKKLTEKRSAVVAMRLNAGVPVSVSALKRCLGECWCDGAITTSSSISGVCVSELPLSEEAAASLEFGNASLLVVSAVM